MDHTNPKGKKLISLALIFALLISLFGILPLSASAAETKTIYIFGNHDLFQEKGINKVKFTNMTAFYDFVCSYDAQYLYEDKNFNDVYKVEIPVDLTDNFLFNIFGENDYSAGAEFTADYFNEENNAVHFTSIGDLSLDTQAIIQYYDVEENYPNETTTTLTEVPTTTNPTEATTTTEPTEAPATTKPETTQPATELTQSTTSKPEATEPGTSTKTIYIYGPQSQFQNNNIVNIKVINTSIATPPNLNEDDIIATYDAPFLYTNKVNEDVFSFEFPLDAEGYLWFQGLDSDSNVVFQYFHYNFLNWIKTDACNALYFSQISSNNVGSKGTYYDAEAYLPDATEAPSTETPTTTVTAEPTEAPTTAASATTVAAEPTEATTAAPETTAPGGTTVEVLLGDADGSGKVDVKDVTHIQKHVANIFTLSGENALAANVDGNGTIDVNDATYIQKFLAKYKTDYKIGQLVQF